MARALVIVMSLTLLQSCGSGVANNALPRAANGNTAVFAPNLSRINSIANQPEQAGIPAGAITFPLDNHSFDVAVVAVTGANGPSASMIGVATPESIADWCRRNPDGIAGGREGCVRGTMSSERHRRYILGADCPGHTLRDWSGRMYRHVQRPEPGWADTQTGELFSNENSGLSSDYESRVAQFNILCPASAIALPAG